MKKLLMYYLALLTWIAQILLVFSIIGIPILVYLIDKTYWWGMPFQYVTYNIL